MRIDPQDAAMDFQLAVDSVPDQQRKALLACRVIAEIAARPTESMRVPDLAKRSGITEGALQALMTSPTYRELLEDACRSTCAAMMSRVLSRIDESVCDKDAPPKFLLEAGRTLATMYRALSAGESNQAALDAATLAEKEIARQEALAKTRRSHVQVEVVDADSGSSRPRLD